jgi:hypothetical protein
MVFASAEGQRQGDFHRDTITVDEVDCHDEKEGARVIAETFKEQMFHWQTELQIPTTHIFFVYEDFILYPNKKHSPEREGLSPVRITSLVEGMLIMEQINWVPQMAHLAKQRFTNDRLRRADLWTVGWSTVVMRPGMRAYGWPAMRPASPSSSL